jgi:parallel beta-helix repeat protein
VEDNGRDGISFEDVVGGTILNNTLRRNPEAVLLAGSQNIEVSNNVLEENTIGLSLFVDLDSVPPATLRDLANNSVHHNTVTVPGSGGGVSGALFSYVGSASSPTPYLTNTKQNNLDFNTYHVVNLTDFVWFWGASKNWSGWQALPQDLNGTHVVP